MKRLVILTLVVFLSVVTYGQQFIPLGLGAEKCERKGHGFQPQMHIEGDVLYVCTNQGLYSKDLTSEESTWQLVGFKNVPLQDYVRKGGDILALRYNVNGEFLLLSLDGGKTYEDVTYDLFKDSTYNVNLRSLVQHPSNPNTLLVSSLMGLFQSSDFGQTWSKLTDIRAGFTGYHPLNPEIIYESGESYSMLPYLNISYDSGQTWTYLQLDSPGDNCANRIAFHPVDPNRWVVGGYGIAYLSYDIGHTWDTQIVSDALWRFAIYDDVESDIIYMAGRTNDKIEVMCSGDSGKTWNIPIAEPMKKSSTEVIYDLKQYDDKLLFYTESDVYVISKAELRAKTTFVRSINTVMTGTSSGIYDLLGRRMTSQPTKGICIQNGKKIVCN